MTNGSNVGTALAEAVQHLRATGEPEPASNAQLDAGLLLAHVLGSTRAQLIAAPERAVDAADLVRYRALIERRVSGEPLAYLTGWREFWSLRLAVSPAVLVPRPDTELLVERALALNPARAARVADLGTGCGAIALALASERPGWHVIGTDVSAAALAVARANAAALGLERVEFRHGSWYRPLSGERYELLLSNPPYVAADAPQLIAPPLALEPRLALDGGADGLAHLRAIARAAPAHLRPGGWLLLEHAPAQAAELRRELVAAGLRSVRSHRDLAGHERITEGKDDQI